MASILQQVAACRAPASAGAVLFELFVDRVGDGQYYEESVADGVEGYGAIGYLIGSAAPGMSVTEVAKNTNAKLSRGRKRLLLTVLVAAGLATGGWAWWTDRQYQSGMEEIEAEVMTGRYAIACRKLDKLLLWKTDRNGGIAYLLGSCELARGRSQAAADAWARIAPGSKFAEKAIRGRMRLLHDSGQFAAAERLIDDTADDPRYDRTAMRVLLVPMYSEIGRTDEAEQIIEERWDYLSASGDGALEPAIKLLLQHVALTTKATPVDECRALLERYSKVAPDDDRIWLGQANLAIRTGNVDEAESWLEKCLQRRPEDAAVLSARMRWAVAANRVDVVERLLEQTPSIKSRPAQFHQIHSWLAARRGDLATERRELELLVAVDPTALSAIARLAKLAEQEKQPTRAAEFALQEANTSRALTCYTKLCNRKQPVRDAAELARLAQQLGRQFEARAFLAIAVANRRPGADLGPDHSRVFRSRVK